jgi:hypothetical protein
MVMLRRPMSMRCRRNSTEVVAMAIGAKALAYNSVWQLRADAWSSLEESAAQLALAGAQQKPAEQLTETTAGLLDPLGPVERFWAFPGPQTVQELRRVFTAGKYDRFAGLVAGINRALVTAAAGPGPAAARQPTAYPGQHRRVRAGRPHGLPF